MFRSVFTIYVSCNPKRLDESNYQIVHSKRNENRKNANHGSVYVHTPIQQSNRPQMWPVLLSSVLSVTRTKNDGPMSPSPCHFPQRRYLEFILSCVFLSLFLFGSQSLVLLLLSNFPSIASLAPLFPSFLAVVVSQCVCAVGFLLARLHRGGHPRRAFDCNLKYP